MDLRTCILTKNDCYKAAKTIVPKGVMVHSTAADNTMLHRYVQPDDGALGPNEYGNDWNRPGLDVCVHAFIGTLQDGEIATYQTLPWKWRGWHCGGAGNNTHISFEICEDGLDDELYFERIYAEAAELTAYLCKTYELNPLKDGVVLDHHEGYLRGIASNHSDVSHWFPRFGKDMDDFRADVHRIMNGEDLIVMTLTSTELNALIDQRASVVAASVVNSTMTAKLEGEGTEPSHWAKEEFAEAVKVGITDGSRPRGYATREEAAIMALHATENEQA